MNQPNSIEKPVINDAAMSIFKYLFASRIMDLEEQGSQLATFSKQAQIQHLRGVMKKFMFSRAYSFFKIVILPNNGMDLANAEVSLEIKNFDYFIKDLEPKRYVLAISCTWDTFTAFEETVDKNLIKLGL